MKIKLLHPLVSCICITDNRPEMLIKAILSFDQQNYPNRELIISYPEGDEATKNVIDEVLAANPQRIYGIERLKTDTIGKARNNAVNSCNGEYICMWDDDDIYYYTRIADQYNLLQGSGRYYQSSIVSHIILFDAIDSKAYLSSPYSWNSSLLCKKIHLLAHPCLDTNKFDCQPVIDYLISKNLLFEIDYNPNLYVYVYHGSNLTDYFHFQYLTRKGQLIAGDFSQQIASYLDQIIKINVL